MRAVVTIPFCGRRDEDSVTTDFVGGDVINGDLAKIAIDSGRAEEVPDDFEWEVDDDGKPIIPKELTAPEEKPRKRSRKAAEE